MAPTWTLIANPAAGGGRSRQQAQRAQTALSAAGQRAEIRFTDRPGQAGHLAQQALAAGTERLVVCGGDGTLRETLPALAGQKVPVGLLPFGTANDFARALGLPRRLAPAVQTLLNGRPRCLDLGLVNDQPFATVMACGFDAAINQAVEQGQVPFSGTAAYLYATLLHLGRMHPVPMRLQGEFGQVQGPMLMVAAGNTASYGGGLKIAPQADPADGKLDVCIVRQLSPLAALALLPRLFWGGHLNHPAVQLERTAWLQIDSDEPQVVYADGEPAGHTPLSVKVQPTALRLITPAADQ